MSWVIGTLVLWVLKAITIPLARAMAKGSQPQYAPPITPPQPPQIPGGTPQPQPVQTAPQMTEEMIPTGTYILADCIVLGVAGLLLGLVSGYYFFGISWRAKDWPGMIVFIIASLLGSAIHG